MASMLGYDSGAHVSSRHTIVRRYRPMTDSDWSHIPEVEIKKKLPLVDNLDYIAQVKYRNQEGMAVCSIFDHSDWQIKHIAEHIADGRNTPGLAVISANSFPKLEVTPDIKGRYCSIATWLPSMSLKEYLRNKDSTERNKLLPVIAFQLISAIRYLGSMEFYYSNIGPESIRIRDGMADGVPYVILTDLHMITGVYKERYGTLSITTPQGNEPEGYENERGYRPPEDYRASDDDNMHTISARKRISWMLGATIYDALAGVPPYGFTKTSTGITPWKDGELENVMLGLKTSNQTCLPAEISNPHLDTLMENMMTCFAGNRSTISELNLELVEKLADGSNIKLANEGIIKGTLSMAGAALDLINPFTRHHESTTKVPGSQQAHKI
ncbi:hypothetical protein THASP1DRAFT_33063 [Thamnocephalis sphaerospora]|uniref:Protein kinase domain-containing protein n=1 Tax=Thamnocephalis sphaerospora TaxID=78915 RepID=A0A4P9XHE7_9FUNG|nr:hypothetical protein THASP1DRAFT_33063 [Thamnocephalis sphaerospora]|eukprot:RKP05104.1 hypothetical protein THASP1DRAFT_33063 [Thamnocephalis sphaerospora]